MKQDGWARSDQEKADTFVKHLVKVFTPNAREVGLGKKVVVFDRREST